MVTAELSTLLLDWSTAVIELKLEKVHALLEKEPELLWTPIPHSLDEPPHLLQELQQSLKLGSSFLPVSAIHYCLIHYKDRPDMSEQTQRYRLLVYLIEHSSVHDLDTRFWGECSNSTLHLVCFLGHLNMLKLLVTKGVSTTPSNELGFSPRDVTTADDCLRSLPKRLAPTKSVRPNYSTPDRFKHLKELAEDPTMDENKKKNWISLDRQKSDGRFFRKGHVKETQQKVLTEDEEELEKQRRKRQQDIAQLAKRSAVKNNPLYQKLEKRTFTAPVISSSLVSDSPFTNQPVVTEEPEPMMKRRASKRNSKVINSLQTKSYVSSSVFLQDVEKPKVPSPDQMKEEEEAAVDESTVQSLEIQFNPIPLQKGDEHISNNEVDEEEEMEEEEMEEEEIMDTYFVEEDHRVTVAGESSSDDVNYLSLESETSEDEDIKYTTAEIKRLSRNMLSLVTTTEEKMVIKTKQEEESEEEEMVHSKRFSQHLIHDDSEDEEVEYSASEIKRFSQHIVSNNDDSEGEEIEYSVPEIKRFSQYSVPNMDDDSEEEEEVEYSASEIKRFSQHVIPNMNDDEIVYSKRFSQHIAPNVESDEEKETVHSKRFSHIDEDDTEDEETYEKLYNYEMYPDDDLTSPEEPGVRSSMMEDDSSSEEELEEGTASTVRLATRMVAPVYKSVMVKSEESLKGSEAATRIPPPRRLDSSLSTDTLHSTSAATHVIPTVSNPMSNTAESREPSRQQQQPLRKEQPSRPDRSDLRKSQQVRKGSRDSKRMSGSQKASWTMSMSSWAAILDREFNIEELDPNNKRLTIKEETEQQQKQEPTDLKQETANLRKEEEEEEDVMVNTRPVEEKIEITDEDMHLMLHQGYARSSFDKSTLTLANTLEIKNTSPVVKPSSQEAVPAPQLQEIPRLQSSKSIRRKPIDSMVPTNSLHLPKRASLAADKKFHTMPTISHTARHDQGKLYLHVNGVQDILLPLPKDRAYVRCVVSDGRFEYMSRYEILSQNINFNYECVIDTHRDMIITISLHVRPDYVMKSRTPFSRFFSSKKKKETLSGYVNKEDGAIGQARFALAHMVPVCQETPYMAGFHCFNAWYSRSFKERHRQKKKDPNYDVLKVVGNFDVEMLYLPVTNYQQVFPRNLRECEKALRLNNRTE